MKEKAIIKLSKMTVRRFQVLATGNLRRGNPRNGLPKEVYVKMSSRTKTAEMG
jgi:hypothetical protein